MTATVIDGNNIVCNSPPLNVDITSTVKFSNTLICSDDCGCGPMYPTLPSQYLRYYDYVCNIIIMNDSNYNQVPVQLQL